MKLAATDLGTGVRELIQLALREDAPNGDVTAQATIPAGHQSSARVIARESFCFCGEQFLPLLFQEFGQNLHYEIRARDGEMVRDADVLVTISGATQAILQLERPLLNFLQRLAGVATKTWEVVAQANGITVLDTRKTMPGWRVLDKYAVRVGGGKNHRFSLSDMILVKNNHIDAHGGDIAATLRSVKERKPLYTPVQVEVRSLSELEQTIPFLPEAVLLDNMTDVQIGECLGMLAKRAPTIQAEVSGGVVPGRFAQLSALGVKTVSLGSLTCDARNRDISLRLEGLKES